MLNGCRSNIDQLHVDWDCLYPIVWSASFLPSQSDFSGINAESTVCSQHHKGFEGPTNICAGNRYLRIFSASCLCRIALGGAVLMLEGLSKASKKQAPSKKLKQESACKNAKPEEGARARG
jgi:hypothetical protein